MHSCNDCAWMNHVSLAMSPSLAFHRVIDDPSPELFFFTTWRAVQLACDLYVRAIMSECIGCMCIRTCAGKHYFVERLEIKAETGWGLCSCVCVQCTHDGSMDPSVAVVLIALARTDSFCTAPP